MFFSCIWDVSETRLGCPSPGVAQFSDLALDNLVQLFDPRGKLFGIAFPRNALAQFDHLVAIFRRHAAGPSPVELRSKIQGPIVPCFAREQLRG